MYVFKSVIKRRKECVHQLQRLQEIHGTEVRKVLISDATLDHNVHF